MGFKDKLLERIEKNSIKVNVGEEKIFLKKSGMFKDWHVIYPPIDPDTGKINWINLLFGGKANAVKVFIIGIITLLLVLGVYDLVSSYNETFSNPAVQSCLKNLGITVG